MLKLMLIQRNGATTHRHLDKDIRFSDFHELVSYENFGKSNVATESQKTVYVPHSETTYTMLSVPSAVRVEL